MPSRRAKSSGAAIEATKNGPYVVKGKVRIEDSQGNLLSLEGEVYLCRCGGSHNKPYCDSSHLSNRFVGEPPAKDNGSFKEYPGNALVIRDNRTVCAHVGYCLKGAPEVFQRDRDPWIVPDAGDPPEVVKETISRCPSGVLAYIENGVLSAEWERPPGVRVSKDGPYEVVGGVELQGQLKIQPVVQEHYALCRCGGSSRKPYCDGTHVRIGFRDEGKPGEES